MTKLELIPAGEFPIVKVTKKYIYVRLDKNSILPLPRSEITFTDAELKGKEVQND